jgi:hypothetical protein
MKVFSKFVALGAVAAASTSLAFATPITPGGATVTATNAITVTPTSVLNSVTGTLTAQTFTATYTEYVIQDATNPYGVNDLTFIITLSSSASSANHIEHISDGDGNGAFTNSMFGGISQVNVGYLAGANEGGTDVPLTVDETVDGTVEFNFTGADAIAPGSGTQYLVIQTANTNYTTGNLAAIDSSSDTKRGFVPTAATPEPASLMLLGSGLFGTAGMVFKRRRSSEAAL